MVEFILNNEKITTEKPTSYLLLDLIRYDKSLTGTKMVVEKVTVVPAQF